jgi:hypothetical protein
VPYGIGHSLRLVSPSLSLRPEGGESENLEIPKFRSLSEPRKICKSGCIGDGPQMSDDCWEDSHLRKCIPKYFGQRSIYY